MPGVSFRGTWKTRTSSTGARKFKNVASLAGGGDLSAYLEDVCKIWAESPPVDVCRIGIETPHGDRGVGPSTADVLRIGTVTSRVGAWGFGGHF